MRDNRRSRAAAKDESGQVLLLAALTMAMLLVTTALVVDIGKAYLVQRQLQAGVDAAALAGAQHLPDPIPSGHWRNDWFNKPCGAGVQAAQNAKDARIIVYSIGYDLKGDGTDYQKCRQPHRSPVNKTTAWASSPLSRGARTRHALRPDAARRRPVGPGRGT